MGALDVASKTYLHPRYQRLFFGSLLVLLSISSLFYLNRSRISQSVSNAVHKSKVSYVLPDAIPLKPSLRDIIQALYAPTLQPITAPTFTDPVDGEVFHIPQHPIWTKSLGKRLCLVDIDNRPFDGENELMGKVPTPFDWTTFSNTPSGMLGHYFYAMIHGYDYKFIRTTDYPDRAPYWTKIPALADHLHDYDFVVSIDADAQIRFPQLPFEWLLNRWNVTKETSMTMALDPDDPPNHDVHGRLHDNAGFIVAQNLPRTHDLLKTWAACPDEPSPEFENCARWKHPWPAEQAAFAEYIRTIYNEPNDLNEIPCDEANGTPDFTPNGEFQHGCKGKFVRHHTLSKDAIKETIQNGHMGVIMGRMHQDFNEHKETNTYMRKTNNLTRTDSGDVID
ncbi:hypothetical protein EJ05DRAFT_485979 [Pseudovirgaria hyperparasitica]|uniref:Nucleotide-diphospho-sugar transferase domain-containing protein n=1 Tax=Pseudovirgaria hyperparasitica TaxID=470096 RepID=A0A6A6W6R9_9PEZI|nr:uncharacterized protein EJ05DRAFT_485979 [Pseudovirgaria hyperparasitica]KAF2757899.1 hypothetical protein EJ05DRAFT_485979 [Pseudovirgaria hyperparasitica]